METKGKVEQVSNKDGRYGIKIAGTWYNGWNNSPVNKGDEVNVEFEVNGNFKNIKKVNLLNKAPIEEGTPNKTISMYTSYAKDIFCELWKEGQEAKAATDIMDLSIKLVKQAKEAFEQNDMPEVQEENKEANKA